MREWIYLSAHFDDVALSAGGLIWEQTQRGDRVEVWTICAGDPPSDMPLTDYGRMLHMFWELGDPVPYQRSLEDAAACRVMGAAYRRYTVPDNIYRCAPGSDQAIVQVPDDNFGPLEPVESYLIPPVADFLRKNLPDGCEVAVPLAIGHHRDHILTRRAAERLGLSLWHYVDLPYYERTRPDLGGLIPAGAEAFSLPIGPYALKAWQDAVARYRSQIIMLWGDETEMRAAIDGYLTDGQGGTLWRF